MASAAPSTTSPASGGSSAPSQVKDTARNNLNQLIGKMVANSGSQTNDLVTALNAIATAINAKPSA